MLAQPPEQLSSPRQQGKFILDGADLLPPAEEAKLNARLVELQKQNGCELAVVTIKSTGGIRSREYALRLFNSWKIGQSGLNNGTLFLISKNDRKLEFMTGEGIRPLLTDAVTANILKTQVVPNFKAGKMTQGVINGAESAAAVLQKWTPPTGVQGAPPVAPAQTSSFPLAFWAIGLGTVGTGVYFFSRRGGMCSKCKKARMQRLDPMAASIYLDDLQKLERELKTVDYIVWECPSCHEAEVVAKPSSDAELCRSCQRRTVVSNSRILSEPTYSMSGHGVTEHVCANCDWKSSETYQISRLERDEADEIDTVGTAVSAASWIVDVASSTSSWSSSESSSSSYSDDSGFSGGSSDGGGSSDSW